MVLKYKSILMVTSLCTCVMSFTAGGNNVGCDGSNNEVHLIAPASVVAGEDLYAKCITDGDQQPRVSVLGCKSKVEYLDVNQQNVNCGQLDFVVRNAITSCTFQCFVCGLREKGTVSVVDAKIISSATATNITISKNMPVRLNCTVQASAHSKYHKLVWLEGDAFIPSGDHHYSMWSSQFDYNTSTQDYFLTIRRVVCPASYRCALISASGKVIDSKTLGIHVTETDSVVASLIEYLAQFFEWNSKEIN